MKLLSLILFVFSTSLAQAWDGVIFRPDFSTLDSQGKSQLHLLSKEKKAQILKCQGQWLSSKGVFLIPVTNLKCTGLLAATPLAEALRTQALKPVESLVGKFNDKTIAEFAQKMRDVEIYGSPYGIFESTISSPGEARRFAINLENQKIIIINDAVAKDVPRADGNEFFVLHEFMGALGIDDTNYSNSLTLLTLNSNVISAAEGKVLRVKIKTSIGAGYNKGTIATPTIVGHGMPGQNTDGIERPTIVGHGGDFNEFAFKMNLILNSNNALIADGHPINVTPEELRAAILSARILTLTPAQLQAQGLCSTMAEGEKVCGGATYYPKGQYYFIIVSNEWGQDAAQGNGIALLQWVNEGLVWAIEGRKASGE